MFLRGFPFDELDNLADLPYIGAANWQLNSLSADVPNGFSGKSIYAPGDCQLLCKMPSDQSGKTLYGWVGIKLACNRSGPVMVICNSYVLSTGDQLALYYNLSTEKFELYRGATLLGVSADTFANNAWHIFQYKALIHNSTGLFDLYVNNNPTATIALSGIDTQNQSSDSVLNISFSYAGGAGIYVYRPIFFNGDGSKNNTKVPYNIAHEILHPSADGATEWTPNTGTDAYARINNLQGAPDDDTSYVKADALNDENIVAVGNPSGSIGTVAAVQVNSRAKRSTASAAGVKFGILIGADAQQGIENFLSSTYVNYIDVFETKTGGTEMSSTDLNNLELTAKLTTVS
jgi:hypothetical protein